MIRPSEELRKGNHKMWTEFVASMQEKIAEWWDRSPVSIWQEVHSLEAIAGLIQELLQHCGQTLVTRWVTAQVQNSTASDPTSRHCGSPRASTACPWP